MLIEQVIDRALASLERGAADSPGGVAGRLALARVLRERRRPVVEGFLQGLRAQVELRLTGRSRPRPASQPRQELTLLDESEVAADVEVARTVEAIRGIAEHELLEMQTYTASLAADMELARDHNPLPPEACARALWHGALALPADRGQHTAFVRLAAEPLAHALRRSYAAACARLDREGVEPAAYRTVILPDGRRLSRPGDTGAFLPGHGPQGLVEPVARPGPSTAPSRGMAERFDTRLSRAEVDADTRGLLAQLRAPALRAAGTDGCAPEDEAHPVWRLMEDLILLERTLPPPGHPERERHQRLAEGIVARLAGEATPSVAAFAWAVDRLCALQAHRFARRLGEAGARLAALQALEWRLEATTGAPSTMLDALDVGHLATVPAPLLGSLATPAHANPQAWLDALSPGQWLEVCLQGRHETVMLLWAGERRELWLLADAASHTTWTVRRRALLTLRSEGLARTLQPRGPVRPTRRSGERHADAALPA